MSELEHFAGAVAPVLERLRAAVVREVQADVEPYQHEWDLTEQAARVLVRLRNTVPDRVAGWHNIAAAFVYDAPSTVIRGVDELMGCGLVDRTSDGVCLSNKGREAVANLHRLTSKGVDELWGEHETLCESLIPVVREVAEAAVETSGDAFALVYPVHEPDGDSSANVLAELLTPLHFHRFDAQVSAWRSAGMTANEAKLLKGGPLWRAIEDDTNVRAAAPYSVLKPKRRLDLLSGLGSLPG
jgi:hypothetical protein